MKRQFPKSRSADMHPARHTVGQIPLKRKETSNFSIVNGMVYFLFVETYFVQLQTSE